MVPKAKVLLEDSSLIVQLVLFAVPVHFRSDMVGQVSSEALM